MDDQTDWSPHKSSPIPTRNPSPPPELCNNEAAMADMIKDTLISKEWILSILMRLLKEVEKPKNPEQEEDSEIGVDVSEEQQDEMCQLWDMSMNPEVAKFLQEFKAVSILAKVIKQSRAPRINEICVGILGNMCCVPELCKEMSENETFVSLVSALLSNAEFDPLTLKETTRLMYACLSNQIVSDLWVQAVKDNPYIEELVGFVLRSSTNSELLKSTGDMLDVLLDVSDELCQHWASPGLVESLLEAIHQMGYHNSEELRPFMHVFQLMSTTQTGVQALVENAESVLEPLLHHLSYVCDYEIVIVDDHLPCLCSVVSIIHVLFVSESSITEKLSSDPSLLGKMLKILEGVFHSISHYTHAKNIFPFMASLHGDSASQQPHHHHRHSMHHHHHQHPHHHHRNSSHHNKGSANDRQDHKKEDVSSMCSDSTKKRETSTAQATDSDQIWGMRNRVQAESQKKVKKQDEGEATKVKGGGTSVAFDEGGDRQGGSDDTKGEDGSTDATIDADEQQTVILFQLFQEFFRDFVDSLKLDEGQNPRTESSCEEKDSNRAETSNPPLFLPVLAFLDKCKQLHVSLLAHTLAHHSRKVQTVGPAESTISEKGKASLAHLIYLCKILEYDRAAKLLNEALKEMA